jgi:hypothetical protein
MGLLLFDQNESDSLASVACGWMDQHNVLNRWLCASEKYVFTYVASTTVVVPAMDLHWGSSCGCHVIVKKINERPLPARLVSVHITEKLNSTPTDLSVFLQGKYRNRILKIGDRLCLQHYGQNLIFIVKQICPFKGMNGLKGNFCFGNEQSAHGVSLNGVLCFCVLSACCLCRCSCHSKRTCL